MKRYLLLKPDEDGEPTAFLDDSELGELLDSPEDFGIEEFLTEVPEIDPMYWKEGTALLLKIEVVVPKPTTTKFRL